MVTLGCLIIVSGIIGLTKETVRIGNKVYSLELAITQEERAQGLSGRQLLSEDSGMLFVFNDPGQHGIWMKDTLIDLDIIWLNSQEEVISIKQNISPDTYPEIFRPNQDALYVIELSAGQVEENELKVGDKIDASDYVLKLTGE